jgi:hypothetical protein
MNQSSKIGMVLGLLCVAIVGFIQLQRQTDYVPVSGVIVKMTQKCYHDIRLNRELETNFLPSDERPCGNIPAVPGNVGNKDISRILFIETRYESPVDRQSHDLKTRIHASSIHEPIRVGSTVTVGAHKQQADKAIIKSWSYKS